MEVEDVNLAAQRVAHVFEVASFEATAPLLFQGQRADAVWVQWQFEPGGALEGISLSEAGHTCGVRREQGRWMYGVYQPFHDILAQGLSALEFDPEVIAIYRPWMNPQEAQTWLARLKRIWAPACDHVETQESGAGWNFDCGVFYFHIPVTECVHVGLQRHMRGHSLTLTRLLVRAEAQYQENEEPKTTITGVLHVSESGRIDTDWCEEELCTQFVEEWLPFFRRGCWLSGYSIEATVHEKAEWGQGFSREEIEAWNLKF